MEQIEQWRYIYRGRKKVTVLVGGDLQEKQDATRWTVPGVRAAQSIEPGKEE